MVMSDPPSAITELAAHPTSNAGTETMWRMSRPVGFHFSDSSRVSFQLTVHASLYVFAYYMYNHMHEWKEENWWSIPSAHQILEKSEPRKTYTDIMSACKS